MNRSGSSGVPEPSCTWSIGHETAGDGRRRRPRGCLRWPCRRPPHRRPSPRDSQCRAARRRSGRRRSWHSRARRRARERAASGRSRSPPCAPPAGLRRRARTSSRISGVSGAPAHSTSCTLRGKPPSCFQQVWQPLLACDATDEDDRGAVGVDTEAAHELGIIDPVPALEVNAVVDDAHAGPVEPPGSSAGCRGACPSLTAMTASADSKAVCSIHREIAYPPPSCSAFHGRKGSRLCAVTTCGIPVQQLSQMAGRNWHTRCGSARGQRQRRSSAMARSTAERRQSGIRGGQRTRHQVRLRVCLVTRGTEAAHLHLKLPTQRMDEFGDVYASPPIHVRWISLE